MLRIWDFILLEMGSLDTFSLPLVLALNLWNWSSFRARGERWTFGFEEMGLSLEMASNGNEAGMRYEDLMYHTGDI